MAVSNTTFVNFELLDDIVNEFLVFEGFVHPPKGSSVSMCNLQRVRQLISQAKITDAFELISSICPAFFSANPSLVFAAKLQHIIELARLNRVNDARALCMELAPTALLTPTAYSEFSRTLLVFLYSESDAKSPVKDLWNPARLEALADEICYSLVPLLGISMPRLHILLVYLVTIHNAYHFTQGKESPFQDIENWISASSSASVARSFTEEEIATVPQTDIHHLAQTLGISRDQAIQSILQSGGFLNAVHFELSAMRLNKKQIAPLLFEYVSSVQKLSAAVSSSNVLTARGDVVKKTFPPAAEVFPSSNFCDLYSRLCREDGDSNADHIIAAANQISPNFMQHESALLFRLYLLDMRRRAAANDREGVLKVLRSRLTVFARTSPELSPLLRDASAALVIPQCSLSASLTPSSVARTLIDKLVTTLGLPQPRFLLLLKYLLHTHAVYFARVRMEDDRLERESGRQHQLSCLRQLKQSDVLGVCSTDEIRVGTSEEEEEESSSMEEDPSSAHETKIATIIELLAVSRTQAARLLEQFDGNVENVLASAFDGGESSS